MVTPHFSTPERGFHTPHFSGSPRRKARAISTPGTHVSCIYLWRGWDSTPNLVCFIFGAQLESKLPNLKGLGTTWIRSLFQIRGSLPSDLCSLSQKKWSPACAMCEFYAMAMQKGTIRLSNLCGSLSPLLMKGYLLVPARAFVPGEAIYPLPSVLQEVEQSFPVQPQRPLHHFVCTPRPVPSSPGAHATALLQQKSHTSNAQSLSFTHYLQKTCTTQFAQLPRLWSEKFSSCVNPPLHSLNPSFPLSLFFPHRKASFPSRALQLFSPPIDFHAP